MAVNVQDLCMEYEQLLSQRRQWEPAWRDLVEFIRSNAKRIRDFQVPGAKQTERLYDPTAPDANRKLARQHGMVASFSRALTEGLTAQQTDAQFDAALDQAIESIYQASKT